MSEELSAKEVMNKPEQTKPKRQGKPKKSKYRIGTFDEYKVGDTASKFGFACVATDMGEEYPILITECEPEDIKSLVDAGKAVEL